MARIVPVLLLVPLLLSLDPDVTARPSPGPWFARIDLDGIPRLFSEAPERAFRPGWWFTSQPVVAGGRLYAVSGGFLLCLPWGDERGPE